jgi:hypothetical protein
MADPGALDDFLEYARAQQDYTVSA